LRKALLEKAGPYLFRILKTSRDLNIGEKKLGEFLCTLREENANGYLWAESSKSGIRGGPDLTGQKAVADRDKKGKPPAAGSTPSFGAGEATLQLSHRQEDGPVESLLLVLGISERRTKALFKLSCKSAKAPAVQGSLGKERKREVT